MARIETANISAAEGKQKELFGLVEKKLGRVPNMLSTLGHSPAALEAYLVLSETLSGGKLDAKTREQIALVVAQENQCGYCTAAHTAIGKMVGLSDSEVEAARTGNAGDQKTEALLAFAKTIVEQRGNVSDLELQGLREHGVDDAEIAEVVANVSLNIFTNYFNHIADPEVDF